jgi:hypothetical protein
MEVPYVVLNVDASFWKRVRAVDFWGIFCLERGESGGCCKCSVAPLNN